MVSPENILKVTLEGLNKFICANIYMHIYAYIHVITNDEKRAYEFEKDQGELYGRVWRQEMKEEM